MHKTQKKPQKKPPRCYDDFDFSSIETRRLAFEKLRLKRAIAECNAADAKAADAKTADVAKAKLPNAEVRICGGRLVLVYVFNDDE